MNTYQPLKGLLWRLYVLKLKKNNLIIMLKQALTVCVWLDK